MVIQISSYGIRFKGSIGKEIVAPMAGKVIMAEQHFYAGNKIILDHGGGLFTSYSHLNGLLLMKER